MMHRKLNNLAVLLFRLTLLGTTLSACVVPPIHDREFLDIQGVYPVPFPEGPYTLYEPEWSPTEDRIATLGHKQERETVLYVINTLKDEWKLLTPPTEFFVSKFSWSPGGEKIVFDGDQYAPEFRSGIWLADLRTGTVDLLVSTDQIGGGIYDIDWSPTGNSLALIVIGPSSFLVKVLDISTLKEETLYQRSTEYSEIREVEWSPTEEWLAISFEPSLPVMLLKVDGSETRSLQIESKIRTSLKWNSQDLFSYSGLSWLPDGQWLAVLITSYVQDGTIVLTPMSGDCVIALDPAVLGETSSMDLSTDGTRIVIKNLTGRGLYIVDVEEAFGSEVLPSNLMCP